MHVHMRMMVMCTRFMRFESDFGERFSASEFEFELDIGSYVRTDSRLR